MTHVRRPNRRPIPGLDELVNGGVCASTRKIRYLDSRTAQRALAQVATEDPDPERRATLHIYRHDDCGDWHVGHSVPRGTR